MIVSIPDLCNFTFILFLRYFRMTDLGSVTYDSIPDSEDLETTKVEINIPEHPHKFHKKPHGIPRKQTNSHPPTIVEAPSMEREEEENMSMNPSASTDPAKVNLKEKGDFAKTGKQQSGSNDVGAKSLKRTKAVVDSEFHKTVEENRLSSASEKSFGSGDKLTDNDSLETGDKIGYTNVIADVTVHECNVDNCSMDIPLGIHECNIDNCSMDISDFGAQGDVSSINTSLCSTQCNKGEITGNSGNDTFHSIESDIEHNQALDEAHPDTKDSGVTVDEIKLEEKGSDNKIKIGSIVSTAEIHHHVKKSESLEKIEKQIIPNGSSDINSKSIKADTDCNKNETKASVRFKEKSDGEIQEETIVPLHSMPIEGKPKKDAATKRETWASRKLKKTFGLKEKHEGEDDVDGKGMNIQGS